MSFEEFARTRLPALLRFAKVLCGERGLAEDVVQDVLVKAHSRWDHIDPLDQPEAYVRRMIVNEFLSWRRKWSRMVPSAEVADLGVSDSTAQLADREQLVHEMGKLSRRQRAVLVLRYYGGLTDVEIAEDLGCSPGTVRSHMSRALATLRVNMADDPALAKEG